MKLYFKTGLLFLLLAKTGAGQYRDFSLQKDCSILHGILLAATELRYTGNTLTSFFGTPVETKKYSVKARIVVQTSCNGDEATFDSATANYEIEIGYDSSRLIHDLFLDSIYRYWTQKDSGYLKMYQYLPAYTHLFYQRGSYAMYDFPGNNNTGFFYILWSNDKAMKVTFRGLDRNIGWGGLSGFLSHVVVFSTPDGPIKPAYQSGFPPLQFLEMYRNKFFCK